LILNGWIKPRNTFL